MFKNMRLVIFFNMFLNLSFKIMTSFANIARTTASTSKFVYKERFQIIRNWVLKKSAVSYNNKLLHKSLYTQQKKLSSPTQGCSLPIFTANETITDLTQY